MAMMTLVFNTAEKKHPGAQRVVLSEQRPQRRRDVYRPVLQAAGRNQLHVVGDSLFASELTAGLRPLLRKTLEYGLEIVGWVMLWYPIEVLGKSDCFQ